MTGGNYDITSDSPNIIFVNGVPYPYSITNVGGEIVYLGDERNVTPYNGFPLNPGAMRVWGRDIPLYAITGAGKTSRVNVSIGDGAVTDPAQIASQIISQGLAAQIAAATNALGVPSVNRETELVVQTLNVTGTSYVSLSGLSAYKSLVVQLSLSEASSATVSNRTVDMSLNWGGVSPWLGYIGTTAMTVSVSHDGSGLIGSSFLRSICPVVTDAATISIDQGAFAGATSARLVVYGSLREISRAQTVVLPNAPSGVPYGWTNVGTGAYNATITLGAGAAQYLFYPEVRPGQTLYVATRCTTAAATNSNLLAWAAPSDSDTWAVMTANIVDADDIKTGAVAPTPSKRGFTRTAFDIPDSAGSFGVAVINNNGIAATYVLVAYYADDNHFGTV